jgi:hypothetical protein
VQGVVGHVRDARAGDDLDQAWAGGAKKGGKWVEEWGRGV